MKEQLEYLVDNIYVSVANTVFRQCVGIPMGTDCAPLLANEYTYMKEQLKSEQLKSNMAKARRFLNTFRYNIYIYCLLKIRYATTPVLKAGHLVSCLCVYVCVCVCVCVCVFGGLFSFYIWMEGLCVVGWWVGGREGGGYGFFLVFLFTIFQLSDLCLVVLLPRQAVLR